MVQRVMMICLAGFVVLYAQDTRLEYIPAQWDQILQQVKEIRETETAMKDSLTEVILSEDEAIREKERDEKRVLRWKADNIDSPDSPEEFKSLFHFSPNHQDATGTCWSFSATSFVESETARLNGKKIKLSEMHTVYYEYLEKVRRFAQKRGKSYVGQGSQIGSGLRIMDWYGLVPESVYPGKKREYHDHERMYEEIVDYLDFIESHKIWDIERVLEGVKTILNHYMGEPPVEFEFAGKSWTPRDFAREFLGFEARDYVDLISTIKEPFYTFTEFDVPDNWWRDSSYYNIPLEQWMDVIQSAVSDGYTIAIGGDVSEPSFYKEKDIAVTTPVDIPEKHIDQESREYRIYNGCTTDDHGVHIVGYTRHGGRDWYLVKDSGSTGRAGNVFGYMFYREDYIKLKMLGITLHRDVAEKVIGKF